jgi:hypothetical protein
MYIILEDRNYIDIAAYVDAIENACKDLTSNFSCVAVLNRKGIVRQDDIDLLFNTLDLISAYGAGKIILVRKNKNNSGFFQRKPLNFQADFTVENARNIQEAENMLDERNQAGSYVP